MKRQLSVILSALFALGTAAPSRADGTAFFLTLHFAEQRQFVIRCPAHLECEVQLEPGERIADGYNSDIADWAPHMGYNGTGTLTPHLILRPSRPGLRTNIILTTTKRTYHFLALSTGSDTPSYYTFVYDDATYRETGRLALATQTALDAQNAASPPGPVPTPADVADLRTVCIDWAYSYYHDTSLPNDHKTHARPETAEIPAEWVPQYVCTDGRHTFVDFAPTPEEPSDTPVYFAVTNDGDEVINATFNQHRRRYVLDGVYPDVLLELGTQDRPLRIRIIHALPRHRARVDGDPVAIATPMPLPTPFPMDNRVFVAPSPLLSAPTLGVDPTAAPTVSPAPKPAPSTSAPAPLRTDSPIPALSTSTPIPSRPSAPVALPQDAGTPVPLPTSQPEPVYTQAALLTTAASASGIYYDSGSPTARFDSLETVAQSSPRVVAPAKIPRRPVFTTEARRRTGFIEHARLVKKRASRAAISPDSSKHYLLDDRTSSRAGVYHG